MKQISSFLILIIICVQASESPFKVTITHDKLSHTESELELFFFESLDDSIVFASSLRKPKSERHKSILDLRYLSDEYLKKNKKKQLTFATHTPSIYFVAVHAPDETYTISTGEVSCNDSVRVKVNKDGSLGYIRTTHAAQEKIGWKEA